MAFQYWPREPKYYDIQKKLISVT